MKTIKIVYSSNDWYYEHLAVSIFSLLKNLNKNYFASIIVLDWWITKQHKRKIIDICENLKNWKVEFILMDRGFFSKLPSRWLSQEAFYRLEITDILPDDRIVLYLDVDTIINLDVSQLFEINLGENSVWAVGEISGINYYEDNYKISSKNRWLFFNSGVLLMDLDMLRAENFKKHVYEIIEKYYDTLLFWDQDALNIVLENKRKLLPPKYNALPFLRTTKYGRNILWYSKKEFYEAKNNPVIVHYASKKPWNNTCYHPLEFLYHKYRLEAWFWLYKKPKVTIKSLFEKYYSRFGLILISNLPRSLFRIFVYKPLRAIKKI